ncbi:MAG: 4Fe-4S binding protein [Clostridia bacterium]
MKNFRMSPVPEFSKIEDIPLGASCKAFHITEKNASWRIKRPVINQDKCVDCYRCYLLCPDGAIHREAARNFLIDYDFCKGCGICAFECKARAISMVKETLV